MKEVMVFITGSPTKIVEVPDDDTTLVIKHGDGSQTKLQIITRPFNKGVREDVYVYASNTDVSYEELRSAAFKLGC